METVMMTVMVMVVTVLRRRRLARSNSVYATLPSRYPRLIGADLKGWVDGISPDRGGRAKGDGMGTPSTPSTSQQHTSAIHPSIPHRRPWSFKRYTSPPKASWRRELGLRADIHYLRSLVLLGSRNRHITHLFPSITQSHSQLPTPNSPIPSCGSQFNPNSKGSITPSLRVPTRRPTSLPEGFSTALSA
jgi:hypothetical protein